MKNQKWGERLKKIRELLGLNLRDFALLLGTSAATLSAYERGQREIKSSIIEGIRTKVHLKCASFLIGTNPDPWDDSTPWLQDINLQDTKSLVRSIINELKNK
jgi:transcriptional regulator with XRE-family HTH domain